MLQRRESADLARPEDATERALRGVLSDHSRRAYAGDFRDFARWLHPDDEAPVLTVDDLRLVTTEQIGAYRDHLRRERTLTTATVNRRLAAVRKLMQAAMDRGMRRDNPAKAVRGYKPSSEETPALTEDEARTLLAQPDRETLLGLRDYALLQILIRLGLRREEAHRLHMPDFGSMRGRRVVRIDGKGDKIRTVVVPGDVYDHVAAWVHASGRTMDQDGPLWLELKARGRGTAKAYIIPDAGKPLSVDGIRLVVQRHARAVGLTHIAPHAMRATFITLSLEKGAPLQKVQYAAGHADPRTTERYDRNRQAIDNPATDYIPVL